MMYFKLFSNCVPVAGARMNIVCDLQRGGYLYIPDSLYEILTEHKNKDIELILTLYDQEYKNIIIDYFETLIEREYGFYTDEPQRFPDIDFKFQSPELINNAIIDITKTSLHDYQSIFDQLDALGCSFLQLRFFDIFLVADIIDILTFTKKKRFRNIDLILCNYDGIGRDITANSLIWLFGNIGTITVTNCLTNSKEKLGSSDLVFITEKIESENCCGNISRAYFSFSVKSFSEALSYNTCLNKKISIDKEGMIKNCPSMTTSFGKIGENSLIDVLGNDSFKSYWDINKDQIKICKDCQYRYICTDCRAFTEDAYAKPFKCKYDPYEHVWS